MPKKEKKRKNAMPRMSGKNIQKGSMYGKRQTAAHPRSQSSGTNSADKEWANLTGGNVGP